ESGPITSCPTARATMNAVSVSCAVEAETSNSSTISGSAGRYVSVANWPIAPLRASATSIVPGTPRDTVGSSGGAEPGCGLAPGEGVEVTMGHDTAAAPGRGRSTNPNPPPVVSAADRLPQTADRGSVQLHLG